MEIFVRYRLDHVLFWLATISFHAYNKSYIINKISTADFVGELFVHAILLASDIYGNLWFLTMKGLEDYFLAEQFVKIHKSYLVPIPQINLLKAMKYISEIKNFPPAATFGQRCWNGLRGSW